MPKATRTTGPPPDTRTEKKMPEACSLQTEQEENKSTGKEEKEACSPETGHEEETSTGEEEKEEVGSKPATAGSTPATRPQFASDNPRFEDTPRTKWSMPPNSRREVPLDSCGDSARTSQSSPSNHGGTQPSLDTSSAAAAGKTRDADALIAAMPVEAISQQAEHALDAAEMCASIAKLAGDEALLMGDEHTHLIQCGLHLLDSARCVSQAARSVGQCVAGMPTDVLPLLERIRVADELEREVLAATRDLMRCTDAISEQGLGASTFADKLMLRTRDMAAALRDFTRSGTGQLSGNACQALADALRAIARCARDAADAATAAAFIVGDTQRRAQRLGEMLDKNLKQQEKKSEERRSEAEEREEAEKERTASPSKDKSTKTGGDATTEEEKEEHKEAEDDGYEQDTPQGRRLSDRRLLRKLNAELLGLQKEMRLLVSANPQLLPAVNVAKKERAFALTAELLQQSRQTLLLTRCDNTNAWVHAAEEMVSLVTLAAGWDHVASPSFAARVLRAAALIDGSLLSQMLRKKLLDYCMVVAPEGTCSQQRDIATRFLVAVAELCRYPCSPPGQEQ